MSTLENINTDKKQKTKESLSSPALALAPEPNANDDDNFENLKKKADILFEEQKYTEALQAYTEILSSHPKNKEIHRIYSNRSATYISLENYNEALEDAIKCTSLNPDWPNAWARLGKALVCLERFQDAITVYRKANELHTNHENYNKHIDGILSKLQENLQEGLPKEIQESNMVDVFSSIIKNPLILEAIMNPAIQQKVFAMRSNPMEALNDPDILGVMINMMSVLKNKNKKNN